MALMGVWIMAMIVTIYKPITFSWFSIYWIIHIIFIMEKSENNTVFQYTGDICDNNSNYKW